MTPSRPSWADPRRRGWPAELAALRDGRRVTRLGVGSQARITVPGHYDRAVGTVLKRGRTCYHLRVGRLVLRVPFAGVEPA